MNIDWQGILMGLSIFSALDKKDVEDLIKVSEEKEFAKDDVVIREGERGNSIFIIGFGSVEVVLPWRGEKTLHLTTLHKGEYFGEVALFEKPSRRSATVIATERCVMLEIDGAKFLTLSKSHPEIVMEIIETVTSRLRDVGDQVIKVKLRDMDEKIDTLNTRLEAELRAASATLNATQTVFDQTSRRANEVIESAERSRTRLTTTASIIGTGFTTIVAIFGFVGFSQLQNVTELTTDIEAKAKTLNEKIDQIDAIALNVSNIMEKLDTVNVEIRRFYKKIVLPQFSDELRKDIDNAGKIYRTLLQVQDPDITYETFKIINGQLFANALDKKTDVDEKENSILNMLNTSPTETPRQELLSYFAKLLSFIIDDEWEQFENSLESFKDYARRHRDSPIKDSLPFGIGDYKQLIGLLSVDDTDEKVKKLELAWKQIP